MIRAQLRVQLPPETWIAEVSREFPDATFRLLTGLRDEDGAVELGEARTADPDAVADAFDAHPQVVWHEPLDVTADRLLVRYRTTETALYEFVEQSDLAPEYPIVVEDGWFDFDITGTRAQLDRVRTGLEDSPLAFEAQFVVGHEDGGGLLTDRQRDVLETALRMGYFEVPRETSLADVAEELDVDKSTVSTVLRRGEASLLKWKLSGPEGASERE
ncbi:helix-turn-helix domain-containing protein [Halobacterium bonnevillei]|uniref:Bacterio-opsin activator n=1 Tax=Halobacterium bonnevillei TaxID=2692200 RepID=A0A6B0SK53_9EURY|nr:helix-turn-helix domain-containing protein [Halobacterium bonnevillei]MXR20896.1 bacterio-opsin activator [Halobacterium bonnevillei]